MVPFMELIRVPIECNPRSGHFKHVIFSIHFIACKSLMCKGCTFSFGKLIRSVDPLFCFAARVLMCSLVPCLTWARSAQNQPTCSQGHSEICKIETAYSKGNI